MKTTLAIFCIVLFTSCNTTTNTKKLNKNSYPGNVNGSQAVDTFEKIPTGIYLPVDNDNEDEKYNATIERYFDSLTASWQQLQQANPNTYFQKQYSGTINNEKAVFNLNLRAINIRQQKDLLIWAAIGDTVLLTYFGEANIFGVSGKDSSTVPVCPGCRHDSLILKKSYLLGWNENRHPAMAVRFTKDSTQLEGFYYNHHKKAIAPFILSLTTPSLPLNYIVYRYHKHQKWQNDEVKEVACTVLLGVDVPMRENENYNTLLPFATQATKDGDIVTVEEAANSYKKEYLTKVKQSHIPQARSLIGTYDNTEVIYNQHQWLVLKKESFTGDAWYYGDMGYDYISYDITEHKFVEEKDVFIDNYSDSAHEERLEEITDRESLRGFAFVCPEGVFFRTSGNHGWDVGLVFINWQQIKPFLRQTFIDQHANWLNTSTSTGDNGLAPGN